SIICSPMTSLKTSIKTITYLSDTGCLEIQGASLQTWENITIQDVVTGVKIEAGGTTYNLNNIYVKTCSGVAYDFNNITYSSLTCLAADFVNGTGYKFKDCTGVNLSGCGSEEGTGKIFDIMVVELT
ncbi:hypothetical protein, partial [Escherichia coli]